MDAPPTGRIGRFLNVNSEVSGLAKVGPIRNQADSIMTLLHSPRTLVHLVTLLEEMPTQETLDGAAELAALGLPVGAVFVNRVRHAPLSQAELAAAAKGTLDESVIAAGLRAAGLEAPTHPTRATGRRAGRRGGRALRAGRAGAPRAAPAGRVRASGRGAADAARRHRPRRPVRAGRAPPRRAGPQTEGDAMTTSAPVLDLDRMLADPAVRTLVCCGSGGVGKTTTAAALGLRAAEQGRTVCVLTIDPARRLAQSMGLSQLDNTPRPVHGVDPAKGGRLEAMMLDMKRTFDEIVEAHADPERAAQILANPFYQSMSSSFAGTQEYMAMEKLGQLRAQADAEGSWDLIIVDTPPSRSALDFLDAPKRMGSFLDGRLIRVFTAPARVGGRGALRVVSIGLAPSRTC